MSDTENDSITAQFAAIAASQCLRTGSQEYWTARRAFIANAVNTGFSQNFGYDDSDLRAWQGLCSTVGIDSDELPNIRACKEALANVHANIIDLVDAANGRTTCRTFPSAKACAMYTRQTGKFYPKDEAKENPLLRRFLVEVF